MSGRRTSPVAERAALVATLQHAYSGELAAAYAYRGHWRSLPSSPERESIRTIEEEEWDHRRRVGLWLEVLGEHPQRRLEMTMAVIGRFFGLLCFLPGKFFPMYFAGRLEAQNVQEYVDGSSHAASVGIPECVADLDGMVRVEHQHEQFFSDVVRTHPLLRVTSWLFRWRPLPVITYSDVG